MDFRVHYQGRTLKWFCGRVGRRILTVVYSTECTTAQKANRPVTMLPILVVLFVFSYAILTMLVYEQGQTIESQRSMIREMLQDSTQLAALKSKLARDDSQRLHGKAQAASGPSASAEQHKNSASPKAGGKDGKRPGKSARSLKEAPGRPPSDMQDVRRSTRVI